MGIIEIVPFQNSEDLMISALILTFRVPHEQVKPGEQDDETQRHHQQLQLPSAGAEHPGIVEDWAGEWMERSGWAYSYTGLLQHPFFWRRERKREVINAQDHGRI